MSELNTIKPKNTDTIPPEFYLQSPYMYLQAAGSDGSDQTASGVHLRWSPMRELLKNHLPKGELTNAGSPYKTNIGFNKSDDFVYLYRAPYTQKFPLVIDFKQHKPYLLIESGLVRRWHFNVPGLNNSTTKIVVWFNDITQYDSIRSVVSNPAINPLDLLMKYTGVIEIMPMQKLFFCAELTFNGPINPSISTGCVMLESISVSDQLPDAKKVLSSRKKTCKDFSGNIRTGSNLRESISVNNDSSSLLNEPNSDELIAAVCCENIRYLRFSYQNCCPLSISFQTYHDFFINWNDWQFKGKFGLSNNDNIVEQRLEPTNVKISGTWPKYNDGATVQLKNYKDRWQAKNGLKEAVESYLDLSKTDMQANSVLPSGSPNDDSMMTISYLNMLNLVAMDFHVARMLGLGHLDIMDTSDTVPYIYLTLYETIADPITLKQDPNQKKYHINMSLPTGIKDHRLPPAPYLYPLKYGASMDDADANKSLITDEKGYAPYADIRVVNLEKRHYMYDQNVGQFWETNMEFCMCDYTRPVMFGVEYRKQGDLKWIMPELSHDKDYLDDTGFPESAPIPDHSNPLYVHFEKNEGKHDYALYGINWFSRISPLGNVRTTDETKFPKRNTLLPPFNFGVQYIQKENPLIFTSQSEQLMLQQKEAVNPGGDNSITRVTFDWNHVNHDAYQDADAIELFFRIKQPETVLGEVKSVTELPGKEVEIKTKSYQIVSTNPVQTIKPTIAAGMEAKFVGSLFVTNTGQFVVLGVKQPIAAGEGATFKLKMVDNPVAMDPNNSGEFVTIHKWINPKSGEKFMVVENLANDVQWKKLTKQVQLIKHSNHYETVKESDGIERIYKYSGIYESAKITDLNDGIYKIEFDSYILPQHPDPLVEWYKGAVRLKTNAGIIKVLEVWSVEYKGNKPLVIHAYDPGFASDSIATIGAQDVNYHPGYRLYLNPEPAALFDKNNILPAVGLGSKTTFMAIRAVDSPNIYSALSVPVPLLAREIVVPKMPGLPIGPTFATRPNFYGKSTYTFDTIIDTTNGRKPFSLMFFRAADRTLLDALYKKTTADQVYQNLKLIKDDGFLSQRWLDLVHFVFDGNGNFKSYNGYAFPNPDNTKTNVSFNGNAKPATIVDALKQAIWKSFIPLTKQPVIYDYIKTGYQTSSNKPVTKDQATGNLLNPNNAAFDQAPMVRKFVENNLTKLRFTDYTLDGASNNIYFYYAVEMAVTSERSEPSPIAGPITLVNSYPPEKPIISKVTARTANPLLNILPAILFEVNTYLQSEGIEKFELYRATSGLAAQSVRTMTSVGVFNLNDPILDDFTDCEFPLFGENLYYRVVALRKIFNERNEEEFIPSLPSESVLASIIDVVSPIPPQLSYTIGSETSNPRVLNDVQFKWNKTVYNGTYFLFKLNKQGNWELLYSIKGNEEEMAFNYPLPLAKENENGLLFHRFKIEVINASGIINAVQNELTI
jgi:hypothetical protein